MNEDQKGALTKRMNYEGWGPETCRLAFQFRLVARSAGYEMLLHKLGYPFPSSSTLNRRIRELNCGPGIQNQTIEMLGDTLKDAPQMKRDCVLAFDGAKLDAKLEVFKDRVVGFPTIPCGQSRKRKRPQESNSKASTKSTPVLATEFFALQAKGISEHWKELVGYQYISANADKKELAQFLLQCIQKMESVGLRVRAIISDMGGPNLAIWHELGIEWEHLRGNAHAKYPSPFGINNFSVKNYFENPADPSRRIYCFPDPTHILKNIRNQFEKNDFFFPKDVLEMLADDLTENRACLSDIERLEEGLSKLLVKFCPKLKAWHIHPSNKEKMRVTCAYNVFSAEVKAALLTTEGNKSIGKGAITTAAFIGFVRNWYCLMSNRFPLQGIRLISDSIRHSLENSMKVFSQMRSVGPRGEELGWKPIQSGFLISTHSLLQLSAELLQKGYSYILSVRFTQDSLESYFRLIRKHSGPHCTVTTTSRAAISLTASNQYSHKRNRNFVEVEHSLFSVAQRIKVKRLNQLKQQKLNLSNVPISQACTLIGTVLGKASRASKQSTCCTATSNKSGLIPFASITLPQTSQAERQACYYLCGYLLGQIQFKKRRRTFALCETCGTDLLSAQPPAGLNAYTSKLNRGKLLTVSEKVFSFFLQIYQQVKTIYPQLSNCSDICSILCSRLQYLANQSSLPTCCSAAEKFLKKSVGFLVYLLIQKENQKYQSNLALAWKKSFEKIHPPWLYRRQNPRVPPSNLPRWNNTPSIF